MGSTLVTLTTKEQSRLEALEAKIAMAVNGFAEAGAALREVRDSKLYRASHKTFEDYSREVWGLSSRHTERLMVAASIQETIDNAETRPIGRIPSESVARELAPLADKPAELIGAWQRAQEEHGKPTAAQMRAIVAPPAPSAPEPPAGELVTDGEVIDPPIAASAKATRIPERKALPAPKTGRSSSSMASVTRAVNSALDDGWTLEEIANNIQRAYSERAS